MSKVSFEVLGGKTRIDDVDEFMKNITMFASDHHVCIQVFDASMIFGKRHLHSALLHAIRALEENRMSTQSLEMELLLYAAGERQVTHAISKIGVRKGLLLIAIVVIDSNRRNTDLTKITKEFQERFDVRIDDDVLKGKQDTLRKWGLIDEELQMMSYDEGEDFILEQIAMVDIIK